MFSASRSRAANRVSAVALLLVPILVAGCATPQVGSWRASGAASAAPEGFAPPPTENYRGGYRRGFDPSDGEDLISCLGTAAIIGGAAAAIYLKRYKGRGGGGSDVATAPELAAKPLAEEGGAADPRLPAAPAAALEAPAAAPEGR